MKRRRKQIRDDDEPDGLEVLGLGRDRWVWPDEDDEEVRERREQRAVQALHWER